MKLTKGMKKALSLVLSAAMVVTSANVTVGTASAADEKIKPNAIEGFKVADNASKIAVNFTSSDFTKFVCDGTAWDDKNNAWKSVESSTIKKSDSKYSVETAFDTPRGLGYIDYTGVDGESNATWDSVTLTAGDTTYTLKPASGFAALTPAKKTAYFPSVYSLSGNTNNGKVNQVVIAETDADASVKAKLVCIAAYSEDWKTVFDGSGYYLFVEDKEESDPSTSPSESAETSPSASASGSAADVPSGSAADVPSGSAADVPSGSATDVPSEAPATEAPAESETPAESEAPAPVVTGVDEKDTLFTISEGAASWAEGCYTAVNDNKLDGNTTVRVGAGEMKLTWANPAGIENKTAYYIATDLDSRIVGNGIDFEVKSITADGKDITDQMKGERKLEEEDAETGEKITDVIKASVVNRADRDIHGFAVKGKNVQFALLNEWNPNMAFSYDEDGEPNITEDNIVGAKEVNVVIDVKKAEDYTGPVYGVEAEKALFQITEGAASWAEGCYTEANGEKLDGKTKVNVGEGELKLTWNNPAGIENKTAYYIATTLDSTEVGNSVALEVTSLTADGKDILDQMGGERKLEEQDAETGETITDVIKGSVINRADRDIHGFAAKGKNVQFALLNEWNPNMAFSYDEDGEPNITEDNIVGAKKVEAVISVKKIEQNTEESAKPAKPATSSTAAAVTTATAVATKTAVTTTAAVTTPQSVEANTDLKVSSKWVVVAPKKTDSSIKVTSKKAEAASKAAVVKATAKSKKVVSKAVVKNGKLVITLNKKAAKGASTVVTLKTSVLKKDGTIGTKSAKVTVYVRNTAKKYKAAKKKLTMKKNKTAKLVIKGAGKIENKKMALADTLKVQGGLVTIDNLKCAKKKMTLTLKAGKKKAKNKKVVIKVGKKKVNVKVTIK